MLNTKIKGTPLWGEFLNSVFHVILSKARPNVKWCLLNMWTNKKRKQKIPAAFREQIWLRDCKQKFQSKCLTRWCNNTITVFDFQAGHNIPESKGGQTIPSNLVPICARCNLSMGNRYTFTEWNALSAFSNANAKAKAKPVNEVPVKTSNWCCF